MTTREQFIKYVEELLIDWYGDWTFRAEDGDGQQAVEDWEIRFPDLFHYE